MLEMGLKWDQTVGSRLGLFKRGLKIVCFKQSGTIPDSRHLLIKTRKTVPATSKTYLKRRGDMTSQGDPEGFSWLTISWRKEKEIELNWLKKGFLKEQQGHK